MSIDPIIISSLKRYANMIILVKEFIEVKRVEEHEGISAILFEIFLALDKISEELKCARIEEPRKNSN